MIDTPQRPRDSIKVGPTRKRMAHRLLDSSSGDDSNGGSEILPKDGEFKEIKDNMLKLLFKRLRKIQECGLNYTICSIAGWFIYKTKN